MLGRDSLPVSGHSRPDLDTPLGQMVEKGQGAAKMQWQRLDRFSDFSGKDFCDGDGNRVTPIADQSSSSSPLHLCFLERFNLVLRAFEDFTNFGDAGRIVRAARGRFECGFHDG